MQNRVFGGILALQVVVLAVTFWPSAPSPSRGEALFPELKPNQIVRMTISDALGSRTQIARAGRDWVLTLADDYPAQRDEVISLIGKIQALRADRLVTQTSASHKQLKVAQDEFERLVEFELTDGAVHSLYLGTAPSFQARHVRADNQGAVYLTLGFSASDVPADAGSWVDPLYFSVPQDSVEALTLENVNGRFRFSREIGEWVMADLPAGRSLDQSVVESLVRQIASLLMLHPLGKQELDEYGLGDPNARITVETRQGEDNPISHLFRVGTQSEDDGSYVLISSDSEYHVRVDELIVKEFVQNALEDFLETPPAPQSETSTEQTP